MKNLLSFLLATLLSLPVVAADAPALTAKPASYDAECASCHMAFPPHLMGQKNWQNIMSSLDKHFGSDASLDSKTQAEITKWLVKNAATKQKYSAIAPDNRITKSYWFFSEHDEVKAEVWKRVGVKSPANCLACHTDGVSGAFSEKNIRIPAK
jgi:nitrate/TMAO reductase-like tetraheme cytochrome c subunit